jgi:hypothetical protein
VTTHLRAAAVGVAIASTLLVAACGGGGNGEDSKSADQIVKDAQAALRSAGSYHMSGKVSSDGGDVTLDIKVQGKSSSTGHIAEGGVAFDFVQTGGKLYIKGKELFAKAAPQVADQIGDKWVTGPKDDSHFSTAADTISQFADPASLADSLGSSGGPYSKQGNTTVNGQSAVVVKGKDGTLDVAASGPAYPLHLDGGSHGSLDMTDYGKNFGIKAPAGALDVTPLASSSNSDSSGNTKAVVDASKVRDGVLLIAQGAITESSGSVSDAWGVGALVAKQLPSEIDVVLQTGDLSAQPPATPTKLVLIAEEGSNGDLFGVVALDTSGKCEVGALTGTPPNQNPMKATVPAGEDCTAQNAITALGG